ncbi:SMI1/KNR4 family protein [Streptomyces lonegramiae]|uniref:SMI1/KNR4 family protein n=1 Tax=Streptomyces lonegramiae TaxID=3075524 RepID=A0ABU2XKZ4_9ACTN|nr:SMI1/KNR4 family protein [Streptomyces sp. DSM 41529]MDT0545755.1 SMI1/KNR4 family protein [Streptomyces sp. DSM 41529]
MSSHPTDAPTDAPTGEPTDDPHDDLIGTQTPVRRLTDPDEAIAALERAVPGLAAHRRPEPVAIDWAVLEEGLGTPLPADYKRLAECYPDFILGDFLLPNLPRPGKERYLLDGIRETLTEDLRDWWEHDMTAGLRLYPAPGGLLPWGDSNQGDMFLWSTTGDGPGEWLVTVASHNGGWWHYAGGAVQFLAELCDGTLEPWELPRVGVDVIAL